MYKINFVSRVLCTRCGDYACTAYLMHTLRTCLFTDTYSYAPTYLMTKRVEHYSALLTKPFESTTIIIKKVKIQAK